MQHNGLLLDNIKMEFHRMPIYNATIHPRYPATLPDECIGSYGMRVHLYSRQARLHLSIGFLLKQSRGNQTL